MGAGAELFVSHEYAVYFECAVEIEGLMIELKERFTIAIVTHDLQQAARVATGFMYVDTSKGGRTAYLVEFGNTRPKNARSCWLRGRTDSVALLGSGWGGSTQ